MSRPNHDTRNSERVRGFMSFLIFVFVLLLGFSSCAKSVFLNAQRIQNSFTDFNYVCSFENDINDYASDLFFKNGLSTDSIDSVLDYDFCYRIIDEYTCASLGIGSYSQSTAQSTIEEKRDEIKALVKSEVKKTSQKYNDKAADSIADNICTYIGNELNIKGMDKLKAALGAGKIASVAGVGASALFVAALSLITYFVGAKAYRSLRAISVSFLSAGFTNLVMSLMATIVFKLKSVDIYPIHLQNALMKHVNECINSVAFCGFCFIIVSLTISSIVWKLKRKGK